MLPLPWLVFRWVRPNAQKINGGLIVPFYAQWSSAAEKQTRGTNNISTLLLLSFAWIFLLLAVAKPQWIGEPVEMPIEGRDLMMAVDLSGSMERPDFLLNGQQVDRLTAVKAVGGEFIERRVGDRIGLILFGKRAYVQTPLTHDRATAKRMLLESEIGLAGKETAIGDAIGLAVKRLRDRPQESRVLILLTDGANTAGEVDPLQAAKLATEIGLKIYTIGVGADRMEIQTFFGSRMIDPSSELDEKTLRGIADETGGKYFRAKDTQELEQIYQQLDRLEPTKKGAQVYRPRMSLYYWPLGFSVLCFIVIGLMRGLIAFQWPVRNNAQHSGTK